MDLVYNGLCKFNEENKTAFAVLVDPDKASKKHLEQLISLSGKCQVDYFLIGGSLLLNDTLNSCISFIKKNSTIPVVIFPGSAMQIDSQADAILLLSLISGRNPELLIGQHVLAAPQLKQSGLEIMPTGYMLIDGNNQTTASYISNTTPIPADKPEIAACTAMAGEMLGLKLLYMDGGSGAKYPVSAEMIEAVKAQTNIPLIVGGGINTAEKAEQSTKAGANMIVIGNAIEKDPMLVSEIGYAVHSSKVKTN